MLTTNVFILKTNQTNIETKSLVYQLNKGDKKAYEKLFLLYYDKLLHIAKGYIGTKEDAEGVVQNIFLKLWDKKTDFTSISNVNNYLFTMTKNACLDLIKHRKVKNSFTQEYVAINSDLQQQFIADEETSAFLEKELEQRITKAIELLPKKRKVVFLKSRFEGMKHAEIAESLGISQRTVENHISNSLQHMRLQLKEFLSL